MSEMPVVLTSEELAEEEKQYRRPAEKPLGEETEVIYIGKTKKFTDYQNKIGIQKLLKNGNKRRAYEHLFLHHHVPVEFRGPYRDANFLMGERRNQHGFAMCTAQSKSTGKLCAAAALNHSSLCSNHGGMLHPLDKYEVDWEKAPRHIRFRYGLLPVDEMTDEELSHGMVRLPDGRWGRRDNIPPEVHDEFVRKLFERADTKLRENLVDAVEVAASIAKGDAFEPADRLNAAKWIFEQVRGKTPQKIEIDVSPKFEQVMSAVITGGSRAESRAKRGIEDAIDAEVVDVEAEAMGDLDLGDEVEIEEDEEIVVPPAYYDPEERTVGQDLEPQPIVHYGPAGKETTDHHPSADGYHAHNVAVDKEIGRSEERRRDFSKKKKTAGEIAEERKEHKEKMRSALKKRKYFQSQGEDTLPSPVDYEVVSVVDEEGDEIEFEAGGEAESGDVVCLRWKTTEEMKDA